METGRRPQDGETEMTRTYKDHMITRNMNGNWIVTYPNGAHSQHRTIACAKEAITVRIEGTV